MKKVSVIIPCYNYEEYIEKCVMSVLLQKVDFEVEILISDDNSSDNSFFLIEMLHKLYNEDFEIKIFKQSKNLGEINNTKFLLDNSCGEYIAYLDADDYWIDSYKLKKQVEFLDNNKDYSMCFSGYIAFDYESKSYIPGKNLYMWLCPPISADLPITREHLTKNNYVSSSSRVFRNYNNLIKDYFYEFPYSDWPLNFELSLLGKIEYLDFPSFIYLQKKDSLYSKIYDFKIEDLVDILKNKLIEHEDMENI